MNTKILEKLWLSTDESSIYIYLLENPKKTLSEISKYTNINRPKLYKIIPNMEESGLIWTVIHGKRKLFIAENPQILNNYFESIKEDYASFIPQIERIYKNSFDKPILKHLTGKTWVRNIYMDIAHTLKKWESFYRYSSRIDIENTSISQKEHNKYRKIRNEKQLQRYVITNEYLTSLKTKKLDKDVVVIPKKIDEFEDNITKLIYANKVAIIDFNTDESFIIESEVFASFERKLFKMLFKFLK
jgi:sugar-specific transcriptional regulator TrmB